jgi:hypothetical protein
VAPFTLPAIKNPTDYLQTRDLILYWLLRPGYSTARSDSALITDSRNALASQFWEGQIRTALKDGGDARFLFENTGTTYYDKGFEMLQVLEDHYRPSSISNTFTTLLSLFNDKQSDAEGIHEFRSRFEGNLSVLSHSSVAIPQILQVMLFLRAIHPRYEGLLNQFASKQKDLSTASIDSILSDAKYMDGFIPVGAKGKPVLPPSTPCTPTAATVITDQNGKEHRSPWEWLASYTPGGISSCWSRSMKGNFYCAVCHSKDKHLPTKCPMLTELGLKLIEVGGGSAGGPKPPAGSPPPAVPAGAPGAKAATVGFQAPLTDDSPAAAPAGMTASLVADEDEDSTDSFRWFGDEDGVTFEEAAKPKASISSYQPVSFHSLLLSGFPRRRSYMLCHSVGGRYYTPSYPGSDAAQGHPYHGQWHTIPFCGCRHWRY